jgi:Helix-turn-helix family
LTVQEEGAVVAETMSAARAMWTMFEPVHDVAYFAPEALQAFTEAGLRGYWRGYFAGRAAPLGGVGAAVVTASFYNFAPAFVARAIPGVWDLITPQEAIAVREAGAAASLRRLLGDREAEAAKAADLLWRAAEDLDFAGRVLSAANSELPVSGDPLTRLWQATTLLREHRGDGHFAALAAAGIDGCEAVVLRCTRDISRDLLQPVRGWTDEQWGAAAGRLTERGLIGDDATLTAAGRAVHDAVEAATDQAAERPWNRMGAAGLAEVADVLLPLARACAAALPEVIPVGRLQPTRP